MNAKEGHFPRRSSLCHWLGLELSKPNTPSLSRVILQNKMPFHNINRKGNTSFINPDSLLRQKEETEIHINDSQSRVTNDSANGVSPGGYLTLRNPSGVNKILLLITTLDLTDVCEFPAALIILWIMNYKKLHDRA